LSEQQKKASNSTLTTYQAQRKLLGQGKKAYDNGTHSLLNVKGVIRTAKGGHEHKALTLYYTE
jgi:hypothetical protein